MSIFFRGALIDQPRYQVWPAPFKRYINTFFDRFSDLKNDHGSKKNVRKLLVYSFDKDNKYLLLVELITNF